ncbi:MULTISPECIES: cytochrome c [Agrobacterium]|uniref:C-type cytochrome n=1 Tax=Agrobacterium tumefaciens TaxID=358 RepID=A0AAE6EHQ2_AGRTU|nr:MULTISPECIES: cytochrome c [Agrobacterium]QCL77222.1 c-type cytochrome [Agrobacterium tumefaciens]QCL82729.1 c-type cytochrome [Agrobacterium tumefaciens]
MLLVLSGIAVIVAGSLTLFVTRLPTSAFDNDIAATKATPELLIRGEMVARQADCVACHSTPVSKPFVGGLEMDTPLGSIFATNITPDKTTGIGNYSLADFDRAVRHGVTPDGRRLYPAMPYPSYAKMTDDDITALYAFFMNDVAPVKQLNEPADIEWPLNIRWPLALWNAMFVDGGVYAQKPGKDERWNRGAYLVQAAGHCGACHTPRGLGMNEKGLDELSPDFLSGAVLDGWYAPSLRQDHNTGLGRWSEEDIFQFLKNGRNRHAVVFGSMTEVYNNSLQFMTESDLRAISHYLKSLPGDPSGDGAPWRYVEAPTSISISKRTPGEQTYAERCGFCHGPDGRGQNQWISPLAGAASSLIEHTDSQINVVLNGSVRVVSNTVPGAYRMPPFREQLTDKEIADVLTYVRSAWGNHGKTVAEEDVKGLRQHTDPASSDPIILQMR